MDLGLAGRRALVTAATGGIGEQIARVLAAEGAEVLINGRTADTVEAALQRARRDLPNARVAPLVADCSTAEGCEQAVAAAGQVDILVNNLGVYEAVPFLETTDRQWLDAFETNILSGVRLSRKLIGQMLARDYGRIVFIASEAALAPAPELPHYSATKTMQLAVSRTLAELTRGTHVTVNAVLPGSSRTAGVADFVSGLFPELTPEDAERRFMDENRPTSLIARLIDPREVADVVAFVCSDRASALNGSTVRVDGGIVRFIM